jgi:hypothetical protein
MSKKQERNNYVTGHRSRGTIKFGHLWLDDEGNLGTTVQSGVMLQAFDARHYCSMDINGVRKGWTINRCPGTYQVICGTDLEADGLGFFVFSEMGDVVLKSPNGKIRLEAQDIELIANGTDNTRGVIELDSNTAVNIQTQNFKVNAKAGIDLFTPFTLDLRANGALKLSSNFVRGLSSASSTKPDKTNPTSTTSYLLSQAYT